MRRLKKAFIALFAASLVAEMCLFVLSCMELLGHPWEPGVFTEWYWISRAVAYSFSLIAAIMLAAQLEKEK